MVDDGLNAIRSGRAGWHHVGSWGRYGVVVVHVGAAGLRGAPVRLTLLIETLVLVAAAAVVACKRY